MAALELFTTLGYHASTTPQIAARAGVAEGTIYRHFSSKQHLLNEVYRGSVRVFLNIMRDTPAHTPCRERLRQIALAWRDIAEQNPALVRLVFVARVRALLDTKSSEIRQELRGKVKRIIASGKAAGQVRPGPAELWADVWLHLIALMLERVASREWAAEYSGTQSLVDVAWQTMGRSILDAQAESPTPRASRDVGRLRTPFKETDQ